MVTIWRSKQQGNLAVAEDRRRWLAAGLAAKSFSSITDVLEGGKLEKATKKRRFIVVEGDEFDTEGHEGLPKIAGAEEHLERYARAIRKLREAGYAASSWLQTTAFFTGRVKPERLKR